MSVYIKGLGMPEHCFVCPCTKDWQNTYVCKITGLPATYDGRARGCPLVEVPEPHGRLIDADALLSEYKGDIWTARTDYAEGLRDVANDVKDAPTVIPASEEAE